MNKKIGIIVCSILLLLLYGCSNDWDALSKNNAAGGLPVRFTAEYPKDGFPNTRAGSGLPDKNEFVKDDVIHVSAAFYLSEDATGAPFATCYTALTMDENGEWVDNNQILDMNWPWNSKSARFHAYYLGDREGPIGGDKTNPSGDIPTEPVLLDRYTYDAEIFNPDPLEATNELVKYGHAVKLQFKHCCTRLTIVGVGDADEYWLKYKHGESETTKLQNACRLIRKADNTLGLEFVPEESGKVTAPVFEMTLDGEEKYKAVTFHLAPGDYSTFSLTRRNGYGYITISDVAGLENLQPNTPYQVSIEKLMGNITQDGNGDGWWDGSDDGKPIYSGFDAQLFMDAIRDSKPYIYNDEGNQIKLLEKTPYRNEVRLMENVDFGGQKFDAVNLGDWSFFDGGGKTISGVAHTLFDQLSGKVSNLRLQGSITANEEEDYKIGNIGTDNAPEYAWGLLARECKGTVENVNLSGAKLEVKVQGRQDIVHNIGLLIGKITPGSKLSKIIVEGESAVTVSSGYGEQAYYITDVGGIIGQCSDGTLDDFDIGFITVTNICKGYSSRNTGGVVGRISKGMVSNGQVYACLDASQATGTWNYAGGVAGTMRTDSESEAQGTVIHNVDVSGSVKGGQVYAVKNNQVITDAHSSTGGIAGHVQHSSVTECTASNQVSVGQHTAGEGHVHEREFFSVGGCLGSIVLSDGNILNNQRLISFDVTIYQSYGSTYHAGVFAGIGNKDDLLKPGNNNTIVGDKMYFVGYNQ
ncbi:GLUG motif-containing protein [Bacteroides fragilis]|jgi:hypothetical protein|uniref:GLUG motif-containing protein n=1 Tax=Bacteroides fragilis TaxID=817 RepID=UPI0018CAA504|nr:GLUG motif-containing protein [Bacteroides fragilis]MBG9213040.1 fimbrillin family protein [Bacteroides fragilis]MBG9226224.1 fimbrillin family protein [Bacteroides fragilis]